MTNEEIELYEKEKIPFFERYIILSDIFVSNQGHSKNNIIIYLSIFYLQIISGFFSPQLGILKSNKKINKILINVEKYIRLKNLFRNDYKSFKFTGYILFTFLIVSGIYFFILIKMTNRQSYFDFKKKLFIYCFNFFKYIAYNIILDMSFAKFCFKGNKNHIILESSCSFKNDFFISFIFLFCFFYAIIMIFIIQIFNNDFLDLSNSYLSKSSCAYDYIMTFHLIIYSFILNQYYLSKYIFLIYNILSSLFFYYYYIHVHLYYEKTIFFLIGIYHSLYVWISFIFFIFYIFPVDNIGLIYLSSSFLVSFASYIISKGLDYKLIYKTPFSKIKNKYYALYFIKEIIKIINSLGEDEEKKLLLMGLLELHKFECTNPICLTKNNNKIYSPKIERWTQEKHNVNNKIFLNTFIVKLLNYWINQNNPFPDLLIILSFFYLHIIGNVCLSIYTLNKISKLKLTNIEFYSFCRLKVKIRNYLIQNLKDNNKQVYCLEELNSSLYFKYEDISKEFIQEIVNDANLSLNFWYILKESRNAINYNEIFKITEIICKTKLKISQLFKQLFKIFNGVNEIFELYSNYVEIVNNDFIKKRNLDVIRKKSDKITIDTIKINYYNILFGKETGIILGSGDIGYEGQIITCNKSIIDLFGYSKDELKGKFCTILMPKILSEIHNSFIENYLQIGQRDILGKKSFKSFAKDKDNNIFMVNIALNLFPVLNKSVLFIVMITKEKIEDLILLDNKYNIIGMTNHLIQKFNIENKELFTMYEIPFYSICRQFIRLYQNMIIIKNKKLILNPLTMAKRRISDIKNKMSGILQKVINEKKTKNDSNNNESLVIKGKNNNKETLDSIQNITLNSNLSDISNKLRTSLLNNYEPSTPITPVINRSFFFRQSFFNDKTLEKTIILEDISNLEPPEELLDFNENVELESEIKFPYFILNFRNNNLLKKDSFINVDTINEEYNEQSSLNDFTYFIEEEIPFKMNNNNKRKNSKLEIKKNKTLKSSYNDSQRGKNKNDFYKSEEEIIFLNKINKYKVLFSKGEFIELKDYINSSYFEGEYQIGNKFHLIFEKFKFGSKENSAYYVKVIENKDLENFIEDENEEEDLMNNNILSQTEKKNEGIKQIKKVKTECLKKLYKINLEKRKNLMLLYEEFLKMSSFDIKFQEKLIKSKEEIISYSSIHGKVKLEILIDENSSQTSSTYNENLSKKNRIEENRNNAFKTINSYYMLKYYKVILFFIFTSFVIFLPLILNLFDQLCNNLFNVTNINNKLYQTTNWMTFLVSTLISFDTVFLLSTNNLIDNFSYNIYLNSNDIYFNRLKNYSLEWIDNIMTNFSLVEKSIVVFTSESKNLFWEKESIDNMNNIYNSKEPYPFALFQILASSSVLLNDNEYINYLLHLKDINEFKKKNFIYYAFNTINNAYNSFLPKNLEKIKEIPEILKEFNNNSLHNIRFTCSCFVVIIIIIIIGNTFILYKTNKNIKDGFEKISKINSFEIDESIKNLEQFSLLLKKYIDGNYEDNNYFNFNNLKDIENKINNTNISFNFSRNLSKNILNEEEDKKDNISTEKKKKEDEFNLLEIESDKKKSLQLFKYNYIQSLILAIIGIELILTTLLITKSIVKSTNKILNIQIYIYELVLSASISLLDLKYSFTYFPIEHKINYLSINSNFSLQEIMNNIAKFDDILKLYNDMQINICDATFNNKTQNEKYDFCLIDSKVKVVNNTNSIFNLIKSKVEILMELMNYYISQNQNYDTRQLYSSVEIEECEYLFYNYVISFIDKIASATLNNQKKKLKYNKSIVLSFYFIVIFEVLIYIFYILFLFQKRIIYLLSVARCIFRIIPINIIYSTQELSSYIENDFNN